MRVLVAVVVSAVLAQPVCAQHRPQTREGFFIGLGLGAGSLGFGADASNADRETSFSGYLKLGAALSPKVLLGAETNGWTKSEGGTTTTGGDFIAAVYFYPSATGGFFLKGGLGLFAISDDAAFQGSAAGPAAQIGIGYDARVGRNFSLTPFLNFISSSGAELKIDGLKTGVNIDPNLVQFGLGVTWH